MGQRKRTSRRRDEDVYLQTKLLHARLSICESRLCLLRALAPAFFCHYELRPKQMCFRGHPFSLSGEALLFLPQNSHVKIISDPQKSKLKKATTPNHAAQ